jgi:hypothetical protein
MGASAPVREDAPVFVTSPAKLTAWAVEQDTVSSPITLTAEQIARVQAYHDELQAKYRSIPPLSHHNHKPLGELHPF